MIISMYQNADGSMSYSSSDIHGGRVERSQKDHPYSYSPYLKWGRACGTHEQGFRFAYSDRITSIRHLKVDEQQNPAIVEKLLSDEMNEPVKLIAIAEGANCSNGYPYWLYGFKPLNPQPSEQNTSAVNEGLFAD